LHIYNLLPIFLIRRINIYIGFLFLFARLPPGITPCFLPGESLNSTYKNNLSHSAFIQKGSIFAFLHVSRLKILTVAWLMFMVCNSLIFVWVLLVFLLFLHGPRIVLLLFTRIPENPGCCIAVAFCAAILFLPFNVTVDPAVTLYSYC
jgi:hypothetical protein